MRFVLAIALASSALGISDATACINSIGTDARGQRFEPAYEVGKSLLPVLQDREPRQWRLKEAANTIAKAKRAPDLRHLTELAILLMYQGQYESATKLLIKLEDRYPGHAETAANLGTALELAGHDRVALRWIRIGIRRNARDHLGTEWLHARILEAKLAAASRPGLSLEHSVAGIEFGTETVPLLPAMPRGNDGQRLAPWELNLALMYQLYERTQFVGPPDPLVANLLSDWATLNLAGGSIESAATLYPLAERFGMQGTALVAARQRFIADTLAKASDDAPASSTCAICQPL